MVSNGLLSQRYEISPANIATTKEHKDYRLQRTFGRKGEKLSSLSVRVKLEPRSVRDRNASFAASVSAYKERVKNLKREMTLKN